LALTTKLPPQRTGLTGKAAGFIFRVNWAVLGFVLTAALAGVSATLLACLEERSGAFRAQR